ncbi:MAG: DUF3592 domain-containing protein [Anaerolineae bacterium]|nr:DUF3592 domain-containing protein [Anaerolineae bacterium]
MFDSSAFILRDENLAYLKGEKPYPPSIANRRDLQIITSALIPFIIITIGLVIFMTKVLVDEMMLIQNSATTQGTVIGREIDDFDDIIYRLSYFFYVDDVMYENQVDISQELYDKYPEESRIEITYVINDPSVSRPSEHNSLPLNLFLGAFTLFWTLILIIGVIWVSRAYRKQGYLKKNGQLVRGQLISATGKIDGDNDFILTMKFSFRAPDTAEIRTEHYNFIANHLRKANLPPEKTPIYIFYVDKKNWDVL